MNFFIDLIYEIYPWLLILIWVFGFTQINSRKSENPSRYQPLSIAFIFFIAYGLIQVIPQSFVQNPYLYYLMFILPPVIHLTAWGFLLKGLLMKDEQPI